MNTICLNPIILRIDGHPRSRVVELHIQLADLPTALDGLDALLEVVRGDGAGGDGRFGHEEDGGLGDEGREHGAGDDGLHGGDRGVGIALVLLFVSMRIE